MHHPGLSQAIRRLPALVLALVFVFSFARAGSAQNEVYLPQDDHFESLLAEAMRRNAEQRPGEAARAITLAEDRLEELVAEGNALPMTRGEEGVYLAARTEIARILLSGGPELLAAYRAARAPYIEALLTEGGEVRDAVKLREVLSRYPLATGDARAPARLADLLLESGALAEAARSYEDARQSTDDPLAQARFDKALAWIRSKRQAGRATTGWPTEGGGPGRGQAADPSVIPGEPAFTVQVPSTEVTERVKAGYARRHLPIPRVFHPVTDGQALFVQDSKVVCAIDPASAKLRWLYVASDPQDARTEEPLLPGQLANPAFRPTLDQGHVYATLDRNTPPIYDPEAPMAEKGQQQTAERARDWRVVCLDAKSGRLRWDAAESEGLVELLRGARHVSPPLVAHGQVYLVVLTEKAGDLSAYAVALDAATGALNFQAFVASRSPSDFLRQAAIAPAPTAAQGRIILQTGLSLIAAVDPHTGATAWANAFPTPPLENEQRIVERGHRFALTSPRLVGEVLIVAPQSSVALLGLDPATGRSVFRVSRGPLTHLCGTTAEGFVLAGSDRRGGTIVQGYDARNGRTRWQTRIREGRLAGHPFATREHVYVPTGDAVTTLSAQTGRPVASAITLSRGASQSGNILATPFGIVLTHASGLTVLEDRAASRERLERAYRAQPSSEAALTWGSFLGRTGELDAALNVLEAGRAGVGAGSDAAR
ncbi:MAG: outer membrane protein assembly factor BamB family protein, partial [Planctomycetota bacterium]